MKIRLTDDEIPEHICPDHGCSMSFEDGDEEGAVYLCPVVDCTQSVTVGTSPNEVLIREYGPGYAGRVRPY